MTDADRQARNQLRLAECYPVFRVKVARLLAAMEGEGFRPRIQHAWRSVAEQQALKAGGTSKLAWGYHNCTAGDGTPESLAVDVLDDDHPLASRPAYLLRLGALARADGLSSGIDWGLPAPLRAAVRVAMETGVIPERGIKLGWDPTHVEWAGISVAHAKLGVRPG